MGVGLLCFNTLLYKVINVDKFSSYEQVCNYSPAYFVAYYTDLDPAN